MDFRVVKVIAASLLLVTAHPDPSGEYCTRFIDLSMPCGCTISPETFEPICGSDGMTYLSTCYLECRNAINKTNIRMDHIGVCSQDSRCACHAVYVPVCGSNGVTYSNECVLNCSKKKDVGLRLIHSGECGRHDENWFSEFGAEEGNPEKCYWHSKLRSYSTRSEDSGKRYGRSCGCRPRNEVTMQPLHIAQPASQPVKHSLCKDEQSTTHSRSTEGRYMNQAVPKNCVCAGIHKPVCGNNHLTYANFCVLHCSAKRNPDVKLLRWGDCQTVH